MIQENTTLILFLLFICTSLCIYFFIDFKSIKSQNKLQLDIIYNQIAKEKILKEHYNNKNNLADKNNKEIFQKIATLKTKIINIDFTLHELLKVIQL